MNPDLPDWLWATSSIVMGVTGSLAIATNLIVIVAYIRNKSVSEFIINRFDPYVP